MPMNDSNEKNKAQASTEVTCECTEEVSQEDREQIRTQLYAVGQQLRRDYNMQVPVIRRYLHEMVDVSV